MFAVTWEDAGVSGVAGFDLCKTVDGHSAEAEF